MPGEGGGEVRLIVLDLDSKEMWAWHPLRGTRRVGLTEVLNAGEIVEAENRRITAEANAFLSEGEEAEKARTK